MEPQFPATITCKCGGVAHFRGIQKADELGYRFPIYDCEKCLSTISGERYPTPLETPSEDDDLAMTFEEMADLLVALITRNAGLEREITELRRRLEDSENAVCAFINAVPDSLQGDPKLN